MSIIPVFSGRGSFNVEKCLCRLEQKLRAEMKEVVKEELTEALKDQQTTISDNVIQCLRSGAVTPAPMSATPDPAIQQARIMTLLQQGQLNEAFQVVSIDCLPNG